MDNYKRRQTRGPRLLTGNLIRNLIIKGELTDKEICERVIAKYPDAHTSTKAVQYYRYQLRTEGKIPPAKINRRKEKTILMWELIPTPGAGFQDMLFGPKLEKIEGSYTGQALIRRCRQVYQKITNSTTKSANDRLYSVPTCALYLANIGWECVEFQTTVKTKEYIKEEE